MSKDDDSFTPTMPCIKLLTLPNSYDCMYVSGNNQFYTHGDGGYINVSCIFMLELSSLYRVATTLTLAASLEKLAYVYDNTRCAFDRATGDLTCR